MAMKILVPTDFSKPSLAALIYATEMVKKLRGEIVLLWFNSVQTGRKTLNRWKKLEQEMNKVASEDAQHLMEELKTEVKGSVTITYHTTSGASFAESVNDFAREHDVDMIVMGTKGASGLKKVVMGSNAASMIDLSTIPVLVVPATVKYQPLKKIVYASDLSNWELEIKTIVSIASIYHAALHVLHVTPTAVIKKQDKAFVPELIKTAGYEKIVYKDVSSDNIQKSIDTYIQEINADMLAMFTHKLDFYEKLFGRSVTRQLAFHSSVPLLTFNKTTIL
jgi:nucleotide-binding universal stress UspA family protein